MTWNATLALDYTRQADKTVARFRHDGPLRILRSLYPEGEAICHNVIVHPPGGLVGGDTLEMAFSAGAGAHGLVTTPGATRFYRSAGARALQRADLTLQADARMEWLPLEVILHSACMAENRLTMRLGAGAELIGWDITAFGLPASGQPFDEGSLRQHIEVPGVWLERAHIAATDTRLLNSPLGLAGHRCMATLFFVAGNPLARQRRQQALDVARHVIDSHCLLATAGATSPNAQVVVVRVLAPLVEPAMQLLRQIWQAWRHHFWRLGTALPRIWSM